MLYINRILLFVLFLLFVGGQETQLLAQETDRRRAFIFPLMYKNPTNHNWSDQTYRYERRLNQNVLFGDPDGFNISINRLEGGTKLKVQNEQLSELSLKARILGQFTYVIGIPLHFIGEDTHVDVTFGTNEPQYINPEVDGGVDAWASYLLRAKVFPQKQRYAPELIFQNASGGWEKSASDLSHGNRRQEWMLIVPIWAAGSDTMAEDDYQSLLGEYQSRADKTEYHPHQEPGNFHLVTYVLVGKAKEEGNILSLLFDQMPGVFKQPVGAEGLGWGITGEIEAPKAPHKFIDRYEVGGNIGALYSIAPDAQKSPDALSNGFPYPLGRSAFGGLYFNAVRNGLTLGLSYQEVQNKFPGITNFYNGSNSGQGNHPISGANVENWVLSLNLSVDLNR